MESTPLHTSSNISPSSQKSLRDIYHAVLKGLEIFAKKPIKNSTYFGDVLWLNYINPGTTYHVIRAGHALHIGVNGSVKSYSLQNIGGVFVLRDFYGNDVSLDMLPGIVLRFSGEILGHTQSPPKVTFVCPPRVKRELIESF